MNTLGICLALLLLLFLPELPLPLYELVNLPLLLHPLLVSLLPFSPSPPVSLMSQPLLISEVHLGETEKQTLIVREGFLGHVHCLLHCHGVRDSQGDAEEDEEEEDANCVELALGDAVEAADFTEAFDVPETSKA